jgi:hypothetical protein
MRGIAHQGEAAGKQASEKFQQHNAGRDQERDQQALLVVRTVVVSDPVMMPVPVVIVFAVMMPVPEMIVSAVIMPMALSVMMSVMIESVPVMIVSAAVVASLMVVVVMSVLAVATRFAAVFLIVSVVIAHMSGLAAPPLAGRAVISGFTAGISGVIHSVFLLSALAGYA